MNIDELSARRALVDRLWERSRDEGVRFRAAVAARRRLAATASLDPAPASEYKEAVADSK